MATLHAQLVADVLAYAAKLATTARVASEAGHELTAVNLLSSATAEATSDFNKTVAKIDRTLGAAR